MWKEMTEWRWLELS